MASASFEHVTKRFPGGDVAVSDMSLRIADGELLVILGPSGCGKSTALRLLAGLEAPDSGLLWIGDKVVNEVPTRNRDVSMVFQDYALYPHMSAFDNIGFGLRMQGVPVPEINWRVSRAADVLEIVPILDRKPRELSGGEQQRVALGRAIVREPSVFLFDEPLSSVDAKLRVQMRLELRKIHRKVGGTFIYVTHDQVEAMTMGDRIAVLKDGVLQQVAPPAGVYDHPANVFVAGFIGSPPMNLIPVRVSGAKARGSAIEVDLPRPYAVDRATLGIRPEALSERIDPGVPTIDMVVELAESVGQHQLVYGLIGDDGIVARLESRVRVARGERMRLSLDPRSLHLFDVQTGQAYL
jgi:ABC-type sugar transport system ATPase subunit